MTRLTASREQFIKDEIKERYNDNSDLRQFSRELLAEIDALRAELNIHFNDAKCLHKERDQLKAENGVLVKVNADSISILEENQKLREQRSFSTNQLVKYEGKIDSLKERVAKLREALENGAQGTGFGFGPIARDALAQDDEMEAQG